MAIDMHVVNPADWMQRIVPLMVAHWEECGFDFEFKPSLSRYNALYEGGFLFAIVVLDQDEPIGYCTVSIIEHPHNPDVVFAASDALYLKPEHRRSMTSGRLMQMAENVARERGASRFCWHTRAGTPLAAMLARHNYQPADVVMMRAI